MKRTLANPCRECPFKRTSLPGYLGVDSAPNFVNATARANTPIPCHMEIDYDDPHWEETQLPDAPYCEGSLRFLNNIFKLPRDPEYVAAVRDAPGDGNKIFASRQEFLDHHDNDMNRRIAAEHGTNTDRYEGTHVD